MALHITNAPILLHPFPTRSPASKLFPYPTSLCIPICFVALFKTNQILHRYHLLRLIVYHLGMDPTPNPNDITLDMDPDPYEDDTSPPATAPPPSTIEDQLTIIISVVTDMAKQMNSLSARTQALEDRAHAPTHPATTNHTMGSPFCSPPSKKIKGDSLDLSSIYKANILALYIIFDDDGLRIPTITTKCQALLSTLSNNSTFGYTWRTMHNAAKNANLTNRDALGSKASKYFIANPSLVKKVFAGGMFGEPLGCLTNLESWKHDWSLDHVGCLSQGDYVAHCAQKVLVWGKDHEEEVRMKLL